MSLQGEYQYILGRPMTLFQLKNPLRNHNHDLQGYRQPLVKSITPQSAERV
jgi:hypothetical protein